MQRLKIKSRLVLPLCVGMFTFGGMGCETGVEEHDITVDAANDPLNEPRSMLQRYAAGQPLGSEVTGYPSMVERVRQMDPQRADILEKGLAELQKSSGSARRTKAKELLEKLQPSMTGAPAEGETESGEEDTSE